MPTEAGPRPLPGSLLPDGHALAALHVAHHVAHRLRPDLHAAQLCLAGAGRRTGEVYPTRRVLSAPRGVQLWGFLGRES
jgi:hypothetical protein